MGEEVQRRKDELTEELQAVVNKYKRLSRNNYYFAYALLIATIASSALAGVGGLTFIHDEKIVAAVALLPGIFALVSTSFKPQAKANWHSRKVDAARALRRRLKFGLSADPTVDDIKMIAFDLSSLDQTMAREWQADFGLDMPGTPQTKRIEPQTTR